MSKIFKRDAEAVLKDVNSDMVLIREPGVYDATIVRASAIKSENGAYGVDFTFKFDKTGNEQTIYGLYVTKNNGDDNPVGKPVWSSLLTILGIDDPGDTVKTTINIGGKEVTLNLFPTLTGKRIKVSLKVQYDRYKGDIKERISVRRFYRLKDGASGSELINNKDYGKQLLHDQAITEPLYNDGLTKELVYLWKEEQKRKRAADRASKGNGSSGKKAFAKAKRQVEEEPEEDEDDRQGTLPF